jgi:hypothetical protein
LSAVGAVSANRSCAQQPSAAYALRAEETWSLFQAPNARYRCSMPADAAAEFRANTIEELEPLRQLCRLGKLLDIQAWIREGKPVALPLDTPSR